MKSMHSLMSGTVSMLTRKVKLYFAKNTLHFEKKEGLLAVDHDFSLMNILSSKVSGKELEKQMISIWRLAYSFGRGYYTLYAWPDRLSHSLALLLNESLVCLTSDPSEVST